MDDSATQNPILGEVSQMLQSQGAIDASLQAVLEHILARFDCVAGTIHSLNRDSGMLEIRAKKGIPDSILEAVRTIPVGKGMAGLAAQRLEPVQACNLQTDESGVAKPDARKTQMEGSIALPLLVDGALRGTLGVAKPLEYEFGQEERDLLLKLGGVIGERF